MPTTMGPDCNFKTRDDSNDHVTLELTKGLRTSLGILLSKLNYGCDEYGRYFVTTRERIIALQVIEAIEESERVPFNPQDVSIQSIDADYKFDQSLYVPTLKARSRPVRKQKPKSARKKKS